MKKIEVLKMLRRHEKLAAKRHPALEQNRWSKALGYIVLFIGVLYLMFLSVMLAMAANGSRTITSYELMYGFLPFIMTVDFYIRFFAQQTPAQQLKPYVLQPISKYSCIDSFITLSLISPVRFIWFALFLPYAIMSVVFSFGFTVMLGFLLGFYLLLVFNGLFYMLVRSLINVHVLWWILPLGFFAVVFSPWLLGDKMDIMHLFRFYGAWGESFVSFHPLAYMGVLAAIVLLIAVNRRVQFRLVYNELAKVEVTKLRSVTKLDSLNRLGTVGEYLKMEIKSIMRNKNIRKGFLFANLLVLGVSLLVSFTAVYDQIVMVRFWTVYNFTIYGTSLIVKVMCYEGNYIECLMVHRENIVSLLRAKYYLYASLLLLPLLLMLPMVVMGKCSLLLLVSLMVFTAGFTYCVFFQLAIYNKVTMPLNTKFMGKGSMENNYMQIVIGILGYGVPIVLISVLESFIGELAASLVMLSMGLVFVVGHRWWLFNIYERLMRRKYENLASFQATR
ncbi:MAG: DUF5687 family protein [Prevotella sp.]|nr:DUF5687 family protein [Prevotella sp.]